MTNSTHRDIQFQSCANCKSINEFNMAFKSPPLFPKKDFILVGGGHNWTNTTYVLTNLENAYKYQR